MHDDTNQELAALKEQMFKQSQVLFQLRQEEANLIAEISGAQAASKNLAAKVHKLDQNSLRQQELIYNAEFQIQQLERKVSRAQGERSDEEKRALNAKIGELQGVLSNVKAQNAMLHTQCKKIGDELRKSTWTLQSSKKQREQLKADIDELNLVNDAAIQTVRETAKEKEEVMVQHDVMKLEVKRLRDLMNARADDVFGLQNRKFQLEMSMRERKKEIEVHREVQRAAAKVGEEERHKVAMESQERKQKVETLKAKFESVVGRAALEDDGGEDGSRSQAYFVIKAAQKREELQREGDELDEKIRKAEREIRALEKTLHKLNTRNQQYRSSFHKADMSSREAQDLRQLTEQTKLANDALFKKRKELQRLRTDLDEDQRRFKQVRTERSHACARTCENFQKCATTLRLGAAPDRCCYAPLLPPPRAPFIPWIAMRLARSTSNAGNSGHTCSTWKTLSSKWMASSVSSATRSTASSIACKVCRSSTGRTAEYPKTKKRSKNRCSGRRFVKRCLDAARSLARS